MNLQGEKLITSSTFSFKILSPFSQWKNIEPSSGFITIPDVKRRLACTEFIILPCQLVLMLLSQKITEMLNFLPCHRHLDDVFVSETDLSSFLTRSDS